MDDKRIVNLSVKSFVAAIITLLVLMTLTFVFTFILPAGEFQREVTESGHVQIVAGTYQYVDGGISFLHWLASPFLVLGTPAGVSIAVICVFLLVIGGTILPLENCGFMRFMLISIAKKYRDKRYTLLTVISLFFMSLGSIVGSFEEAIPLVPVVVALALSLGWNAQMGVGMSLLPLGCGFAVGVLNLYTVGIAQRLAGLPLFSGVSFRIISFVLVYGLVLLFIRSYAKKLDADPDKTFTQREIDTAEITDDFDDERKVKMRKSVQRFVAIIGFGLLLIMLSSVVTFLQSIITAVMAVLFFAAGTIACLTTGMKVKTFTKMLGKGMLTITPGVLIILMASSIQYTLEVSKTLDTVLNFAVDMTYSLSPFMVVLVLFALVLFMNFFVASASAKAFLLIPLIVPIAQLNDLSSQLSVLAFIYGDGFGNMFYPTSPILLICLGITGVSYSQWFKMTWKFQLGLLTIMITMLLIAQVVGYS